MRFGVCGSECWLDEPTRKNFETVSVDIEKRRNKSMQIYELID